jgi:hypothetical protein
MAAVLMVAAVSNGLENIPVIEELRCWCGAVGTIDSSLTRTVERCAMDHRFSIPWRCRRFTCICCGPLVGLLADLAMLEALPDI